MGSWGEKLFADDTACDVRDAWNDALRATGSAVKATKAVLAEFKAELEDEDDGPVVWLALATTEHKHGYSTARVEKAARRVIAYDLGLERWTKQGPTAERARRREYDRVKQLLDSPCPKPKPIKPPPPLRERSGLAPGDIFRLVLDDTRAKWVCLKVIGRRSETNGVCPTVVLLDIRPDAGAPATWTKVPSLGIRNIGGIDPNVRHSALMLWGWSDRKFDRTRVERIGRVTLSAELKVLARLPILQSTTWTSIGEMAMASFDRATWPVRRPFAPPA